MIRLDSRPSLSAAERYGLTTLVDLSRLLIVDEKPESAGADVVHVTVDPDNGDEGTARARLVHGQWAFAVREGEVGVPRSLACAVTDIAGAGVEQRTSGRDRHGRVPSSENPLVAVGGDGARWRDPVVSRCAVALRRAVVEAAERRPVRVLAPWPEGKRWAVALTHDLDVVAWWPLATALRLAELVRAGHVVSGVRVGAAAVVGALATMLDDAPVWHGVREVLAAELAHQIRSTWFVLSGTPTLATLRAGDLSYRPESRAARRILAAVWSGGHEIGLHGSFVTTEDNTAFVTQRARLRAVAEGEVAGVRQHYLKMRPGVTQRAMAAAGFAYDATFGFPDRNGFRLGVADVVRGWDEGAAQATAVDEVPLTWMDRALTKYQGMEDPTGWIADALGLATACRDVEGLWAGLWHPNQTDALGYPGGLSAYRRLVAELSAQGPWVATLSQITTWRRRRRDARARAIGSDGRVVLGGAAAPSGMELVVEDPRG